MPRSRRDDELVGLALRATEGMSLRERTRATGISYGTWDRWRSGRWKELQGKTRKRLVRFLRSRGLLEEDPTPALLPSERQRLLELVEEMARILRG